MATAEQPIDAVESGLRRLQPLLPGPVRYRLQNALDHFEKAFLLFDVDKEMASFRAITGEEEAATLLIKAIQLRGYPQASKFNPRDHQHKAAVLACVAAIQSTMTPMLKKFDIIFDFERCRVDIRMPFSNFGVVGGDRYQVQPNEPLNLVCTSPGKADEDFYDDALSGLAGAGNFETIKQLIADQANARNTLLYASDSKLPKSSATQQHLKSRKARAMVLSVLAVMVLQSREHLPLVKSAMLAFLKIMARLPADMVKAQPPIEFSR